MKKSNVRTHNKDEQANLRESRAISTEQSLYGYYKLRRDDLNALLSKLSTQKMPMLSPRTKKQKRWP